jgi:hypothetical protein
MVSAGWLFLILYKDATPGTTVELELVVLYIHYERQLYFGFLWSLFASSSANYTSLLWSRHTHAERRVTRPCMFKYRDS